MRLGADPEVFLQDQNNKFLSVIGKIGAGKYDPLQIEDMPKGFTLQEDNVALEFGIPPAASADEFVHHIQAVLQKGLSKLPGLSFSKLSCTVFPEDQMQHPLAHTFGCEPDFNAWTGKENPKPKPPHPFMRSAGGHVHIETKLDPKLVGCACDLFMGVPAVLMDDGAERKQLYGKAGAIRFKPYGVEYRTLSNFWVFDEKLIRWVWTNTKRLLNGLENHADMAIATLAKEGDRIQNCINNNDAKLAKELVKEYQIYVC
jgi:hypothetical protein